MALLFRTLLLCFRGRVHLCRDLVKEGLEDKGEVFLAFRKVVVRPTAVQPQRAGAIFQVRFRFKNFSAATNRRLSLIPTLLIVAQPGFRSKTWLLGQQTGDFIGRYEFDTVAAAEAYRDSLPLQLMRRRAAPESLSYDISSVCESQ